MEKDRAKYLHYIQKSPEWKNIKEIVLNRDKHKCTRCNKDSTEVNLAVHHITYENLFNEMEHLEDLITLCSKCHFKEHRKNWNSKRKKKEPKVKEINPGKARAIQVYKEFRLKIQST